MVPILGDHGAAFAVRPGACPPEFLDRLNEAADHLISLGLAEIPIPQQTPPPEP
ncbi:hypothetical protein [Streptomyces sp. S1]|uniref:hypothetical protein n=1 Tax=Streptomyces sp. S1 TaxID=718288 RepID=UPI003D7472DA